MKKVQGFTLIELVVVIVILGILAAFVIPRFAKLDKDARIAVVEAVGGSIKGAASLAHSISLAQKLAANGSVDMEGTAVTMSNYYPTADDNGIIAAIGSETRGFTKAITEGQIVLKKDGAPTEGTGSCSVTYKAAEANKAPEVTIDTGNC